MKGWKADKRWSDKFLSEIRRILGEHLIDEPPIEEDQERNTDLITLRMAALRVGCRVRRRVNSAGVDQQVRYGDEFTIRMSRPAGTKTELAKIVEGWGDYFFYGFADDDPARLTLWNIGDLRVFRLWYNRQLYKGIHPGQVRPNRDGSSNLIAFKWLELPDEFVIASSHVKDAVLS